MKTIEILYALEEIDENQLYQAEPKPKTVHISRWIRLCAACLVLMLTAGTLFYNLQNRIPLSDASRAVSARYVHSAPQIRTANSLIELTEEEVFTYFNTAIFEGTIVSLHNIEIRFNGEKAYRAIAEIKVDTVYRGTCRKGEIVSILLPCPIADNYHVTDMEIVSQMSAGMRGIFMPIHYDKIDFWEQNGARLVLRDLAEYGFADGSRYAFLQLQDGLSFSRWAYPTIKDAQTLEDIAEYILYMLQQIQG